MTRKLDLDLWAIADGRVTAICGARFYFRQTSAALFFLLIVAAQETCASTVTIAQYTLPSSSFAPTTVAPNVSANLLNDTGSATHIEPGGSYPNSLYLSLDVLATTAAQAVQNNQYFQFSVTPDVGYQLNLATLSFLAARGGASTPRGWVLRSSLDDYAINIATADIPTVQPSLTSFSNNLVGPLYGSVQTSATFRIYGYGPTAGGVGLFFDNITLTGEVLAVPEPASCVLMICLLTFLGTSRLPR